MQRHMSAAIMMAAALLVAVPISAAADSHGPTGIGAVLGEPTGITAKQYVSEDIAIDVTVYWSFVARDTLYLHADYLHHTDSLFDMSADGLSFYAGIGGMVQLSADPAVGVRIPFGLSYFIPDLPVEAFFEVGPMMELYPEVAAGGTAGIGARYYF